MQMRVDAFTVHLRVDINSYVNIHMYIYICVCVCVFVLLVLVAA